MSDISDILVRDYSETSEIVATYKVGVTRKQLESFVETINHYWLDDEEDAPLTVNEVLQNEKLQDYICGEAILDGVAMFDPDEFANSDGWCEVADYR